MFHHSTSAERITGWKSVDQEQTGSFLNGVQKDDLEAVTTAIKKIKTVPGSTEKALFRWMHPENRLVWLDCTFSNMLDDPDLQGIACHYMDVTDQVDTKQHLQHTLKELSHYKSALSESTIILENISDGFIRLDSQLCYTYANKQIGNILKMDVNVLLGKNIWEMFPNAVGSETYHAIQRAYQEQQYVSNEDYYAPLGIWQENRIYPNNGGLSIFIRDITLKKQEEQHLKLLESVITNTTDAVMITEAGLEHPGPKIIYGNAAFGKMTGYAPEEILNRSPRFLQGPKTDPAALNCLKEALLAGQPHETTIVNYTKTGDEFWHQFSVSPIAGESGKVSHYISIGHDVTELKNDQLQKTLLADISIAFASSKDVIQSLTEVLRKLVVFGDFWTAEAWLINGNGEQLELAATYSDTPSSVKFYEETKHITSFKKGVGLPGNTWQSESILYWDDLENNPLFLRGAAGRRHGLRSAYGIPLATGSRFMGVLVLGLPINGGEMELFTSFFEKYCSLLSLELKRKMLEQELIQVFSSVPDIICVIDSNRRFKKVNAAMCKLLGYTNDQICSMTIDQLIHPEDLQESLDRMRNFLNDDESTIYFENRFVSKSREVKYLAWTATKESAKQELFCVAKDITEKKELDRLLNSAFNLAKIGGWQINLQNDSTYWSPTTRLILEVDADTDASLTSGYTFYQKKDQKIIRAKIEDAINERKSSDSEFEIITAAGNLKWVRVIVEPEFLNGVCTRVYGSFQDIDHLKRAEIAAKEAFKEKNNILESIGDAFFAVDTNWNVTYWNHAAEKMMGRTRAKMLGNNLWTCFPENINSESYQHYHTAMETGEVIHFQEFFTRLQAWFEVSAYPSDKGLSIYYKDITERVNYINTIEENNKKLKEISWIQSHVIRGPLCRILGLVWLIKNNPPEEYERAQTLDYLYLSANELDTAIKNIITKTQ